MNALNQIIVEGNVVRKPESRTIPTGTQVCTFPIAVNRFYKSSSGEKAQEVSYFDIDTYGALADACVKWCPKGRGVRVVGRLKQERWKSDDGKQKSRIKIVAEHVEFKPVFRKNDGAPQSPEEPESAGTSESPATRKKLAMLAEAAAAAQSEQEAGEAVF